MWKIPVTGSCAASVSTTRADQLADDASGEAELRPIHYGPIRPSWNGGLPGEFAF